MFLIAAFNWKKVLISIGVVLLSGIVLWIGILFAQLYVMSEISKKTREEVVQSLSLQGVMALIGSSMFFAFSVAMFVFMKVY